MDMYNILSKTINNVSHVVSTKFFRLNVYESYFLIRYKIDGSSKNIYRLFRISLNGSVDPEEIILPTTNMETYTFNQFIISNSHELVLMGENLICVMSLDEMETYIESEEAFEEAVKIIPNIGTVNGITYSSSNNMVYFIADNGGNYRNSCCLYSYNLEESCNPSHRKKIVASMVRRNSSNLFIDNRRNRIFYVSQDSNIYDYYNYGYGRNQTYIMEYSINSSSVLMHPIEPQHGIYRPGQNVRFIPIKLLTLLNSTAPEGIITIDQNGISNALMLNSSERNLAQGHRLEGAENPLEDISNDNFENITLLEVSNNDGKVYYSDTKLDKNKTLHLRIRSYKVIEDKIRKFTLKISADGHNNTLVSYTQSHYINTGDSELGSAHSNSSIEEREGVVPLKNLGFNSIGNCALFDRMRHHNFHAGYRLLPNKLYAVDKKRNILTKDEVEKLIAQRKKPIKRICL